MIPSTHILPATEADGKTRLEPKQRGSGKRFAIHVYQVRVTAQAYTKLQHNYTVAIRTTMVSGMNLFALSTLQNIDTEAVLENALYSSASPTMTHTAMLPNLNLLALFKQQKSETDGGA